MPRAGPMRPQRYHMQAVPARLPCGQPVLHAADAGHGGPHGDALHDVHDGAAVLRRLVAVVDPTRSIHRSEGLRGMRCRRV